MSIMCCLYVPEGIVMAADSRLTRTKPTKTLNLPKNDGEQEKILYVETTYTLSDNAQKVLLIKKTNTGVSFCGDAMINDVTVADFIRKSFSGSASDDEALSSALPDHKSA